MLTAILTIRLKQCLRLLNEVGFFLVLLLLIVLTPMIAGGLFHLTNQTPYLSSIIAVLLLLSIQVNRKDKAFLQKLSDRAYWIFFTEYLIISLPFVAFLIWRQAWMPVLTILPAIAVAPMLNVTLKLGNNRIKPLLRLPGWFGRSYEWISGLRKNFIYILPVYLIGLGLAHFTATILIVLFLLSITTCAFYQEGEPRIFLEISGKTPRQFLTHKIGWHLLTFWLACLPLVILFFWFHPDYWYIFLIAALIVSIFPILAITLKYNSYIPDSQLTQNNVILAVMIGFLCFPFTQPVPLIMAVVYYKKAIQNLKNYL